MPFRGFRGILHCPFSIFNVQFRMTNIIQLLPDSVANQIAAGEVIQRPASLLKELMENAIDAGATEIEIIVKDAGRTLVQVIDNGSGMSETDARMAFERHATSKIKSANDLFSIRTMGFRGEALASIAAVAHVELITCAKDAELGTKIVIAGSKIESQEPVSAPVGSNFIIKNLFYNVPVRRRFLKSNTAEFSHIVSEFQRVVLANPQIGFKLYHNDALSFNLPAIGLKQRIVAVIGKQIQTQLIPVEVESSIIKIHGFTGSPQGAKKRQGDQFFFVNNRFMKHPYLNKAITEAYSKLIASDTYPPYFIYLDVNPELIDINIHPTKTEIKFEDESAIWKILNAGIRESLGKFNAVPSIDFDTEGMIDFPPFKPDEQITPPRVNVNFDFNPFEKSKESHRSTASPKNWESLYDSFNSSQNIDDEDSKDDVIVLPSSGNRGGEQSLLHEDSSLQSSYLQIKNRFILTPVKSGLMIIDQRRAHERVLFERFMSIIRTNKSFSQQILFPETISLNPEDAVLLQGIDEDLKILGFELQNNGDNSFSVTGVPSEFNNLDVVRFLEELIESYRNGEVEPENELKEQLAKIMVHNACMNCGETLTKEEMATLVNKLFRCEMPNFSPAGKPVISIISNEEFEQRFK